MGGDTSSEFDRVLGSANALRHTAPSFVAGAFDELRAGSWSSTERDDRLIDLAYLVTRYLVATSTCALGLGEEDVVELGAPRVKSWQDALEPGPGFFGKLAKRAQGRSEPFTPVRLRQIEQLLEPIAEERNAKAHRRAPVARGSLPALLDTIKPILELQIVTLIGGPSEEEGWLSWEARWHYGVGRPRTTIEQAPEGTVQSHGPLLLLGDQWVDLRPWIVKVEPPPSPSGHPPALVCEIGLRVPSPESAAQLYVGSIAGQAGARAAKDQDKWPERRRPERPEGCCQPASRREQDRHVRALRDAGWTVSDQIGSGSFGTVFRARRDGDAREYAVKVFHAHAMLLDERERFERAIARLGGTSIHGVVRYHEALCNVAPAWVVMDFVEGQTLDAHLRGTLEDRQDLALAIVRAAARLHRVGIVHRDLRPANLVVGEDGSPTIVDLGLARLHNGAGTRSSATLGGLGFGQPPYAAPEQLRPLGGTVRDPRVDVHALAYVVGALLEARELDDIDQVAEDHPWRPILLEAACRDPARRPKDAIELMRRLQLTREATAGQVLGRVFWPNRPELYTVRAAPPHDGLRVWRVPLHGDDEDARKALGRWWAQCCAERPERFVSLVAFDARRAEATVLAPHPSIEPLDAELVAGLPLRAVATLLLDLVEIVETAQRLRADGRGTAPISPTDVAVSPRSGAARVVVLGGTASWQALLDALRKRLRSKSSDRLVQPATTRHEGTLDAAEWIERDLSTYLPAIFRDLELAVRGATRHDPKRDVDRAELRALISPALLLASEWVRDPKPRSAEELARLRHEHAEQERREQHQREERRRRAQFDARQEDRRLEHARLTREADALRRLAEGTKDERERERLYHERDSKRAEAERLREPESYDEPPFVPRDFDPTEYQLERETGTVEIRWESRITDLEPAGEDARPLVHERFDARLRGVTDAALAGRGDAWDRDARLRFVPEALWVIIGAEHDPDAKPETIAKKIEEVRAKSCTWRPFGPFERAWLEGELHRNQIPWRGRRAELARLVARVEDYLNEGGLSNVGEEQALADGERALFQLLRDMLGSCALVVGNDARPLLAFAETSLPLNPDLFPCRADAHDQRARPGTRRAVSLDAVVGWPHGLREVDERWELRVGAPPALPLRALRPPAGARS
ncbi:MAG: serine/threonine protein kinase [Sandaracinaceae bacterium]|nr:serine/threonine protein kinase [Sandaracinaceae bacterium]